MTQIEFKQLENEICALDALKVYSEKALEDYLELSRIYIDILDCVKKFNSVEYSIYQYEYTKKKTLYTLLELNLETQTFKSRCGSYFNFDIYEEILEKDGMRTSILFLEDSIITETKLRPIIINNKLRYANNFGISPTPVFDTSIKDIKHLSGFMKQTIPKEFHKFNGIK